MAKARSKMLTMEDLLKAQQRMAEQGDARAAEQVKRLTEIQRNEEERVKIAKQQRDLEILSDIQERQIKKDEDKIAKATEESQDEIKKGMLDKTGDGLNANVVKLLTDIKKAIQNLKEDEGVTKGKAKPVERDEQKIAEILAQRSKEQGAKATPDLKYSVPTFAEKIGFKSPAEKTAKGYAKSVAGMFSLENIFDVDAIRKRGGGLLGSSIARRVDEKQHAEQVQQAEDQHVKDQMLVNPMRNNKQYKDLSDEDYKTKRESDIRKQYQRNQSVRKQMQGNEAEISRMQEAGYSQADLKKTGLIDKRESLDENLRGHGGDAQYRQQRKSDEAAVAKDSSAEKSKPSKKKTSTVIPAEQATAAAEVVKKSRTGLIGAKKTPDAPKPLPALLMAPPSAEAPITAVGKEAQDENNRMMGEQTEILKKIESNTSKFAQPAKPNAPASEQPAQPVKKEEEGGGGLLGDIADTVMSKGGKYLGKVGGLGKLAKGVGIGGLATLAGEGIQMGGDALKEAGYEQTGKAVAVAGTATKYAGYGAMIGSVIPGVGTAIGAGVGGLIGAGKGIYDQYFGSKSEASKAPAEKEMSVEELKAERDRIAKKGPATDSAQSIQAHKNILASYDRAIAAKENQAKPVEKASPVNAPADNVAPKGSNWNTGYRPAVIPKTASPDTADTVYRRSTDNAAAAQKPTATAPVVINAPTTNNSSSTSNYAPKSPPRNTESSYQQYNRSKYAY